MYTSRACCLQLPSNQSFNKQITGHGMSVGWPDDLGGSTCAQCVCVCVRVRACVRVRVRVCIVCIHVLYAGCYTRYFVKGVKCFPKD